MLCQGPFLSRAGKRLTTAIIRNAVGAAPSTTEILHRGVHGTAHAPQLVNMRKLGPLTAALQALHSDSQLPLLGKGGPGSAAFLSLVSLGRSYASEPLQGTSGSTPTDISPTAGSAANPASSVIQVKAPQDPLTQYTLRQVSKHDTDESCWIVVNGKVYDVTSYLDDHPGGTDSILLNAGVDATDEFNAVHSKEAKELLEKFVIGTVKQGKKAAALTAPPRAQAAAAAGPPLVQLEDPRVRYALPLTEKQQLNHDTFLLRFALASPQTRLGLPCGKHVYLFADIGGEAVARAYTPISGDKDMGTLDFLIKVYWAGAHPLFPEGGKMTQHLARLKVGDTIEVKGPMGKFAYEGRGRYQLNRQPGQAKYMSMIAGGSGITPCYAVLREVLADPQDETRCALIYANKHEEDIWLRKELEELAAAYPDRLHLWYTLEQPPLPSSSSSSQPSWRYSQGFITKDMMAQHLLPAGEQSLALMCGPPVMLEQVAMPALSELGYKPEQQVVF